MRRADRLFQIVQLLRGARLTTARALAERLEVSERTIYRDIADLIGSGVPIDGEAGVGYIMRAGYDMPPLMFNRAELTALMAGLRLIDRLGGTEMAQAAHEARIKIETVLPKSLATAAENIQIHAGPTLSPAPRDRQLLDQLEAATHARQRLTLAYQDAQGQSSARTVRPLGLWLWQTGWTLVAWCELRQDFRMFRIDRIQSAQTGETFPDTPGKNLQALYAQLAKEGTPEANTPCESGR